MFFEEEVVSELFPSEFIHDVNVVCMGERTSTAAQFYGVQPDAKPETPTTEALIKCIVSCSIN
jgi:uroporphyrinogen-III synthase